MHKRNTICRHKRERERERVRERVFNLQRAYIQILSRLNGPTMFDLEFQNINWMKHFFLNFDLRFGIKGFDRCQIYIQRLL